MQNQFDPRTTTGVNAAATTVGVPRAARDAGLRSYMLSVYNYMASGVLLTGIVALLFAPYAADVLVSSTGRGLSGLGWLVTLAPLGFVMVMSFGINRISTGTLQMLFWAFATVMGLSMSTVFLAYTGTSIAQTFFAVAAAFAGLTAYDTQKIKSMYAYVAGTDMMGKVVIMGALNLYLDFVNMFTFLLQFMGDRR